jgi:D-tyrosyl-tRNA(Tyr) deacylase
VSRACVRVDGATIAEIGNGILLLVGVGHDDDEQAASVIVDKVANLRIFPDDHGKMNRSVLDAAGEILVVSQFTLYADTRKGRRPSFVDAAAPERAEPLVQAIAQRLTELGVRVSTGEFGAHMEVDLTNDGPVTILIET